MALYGHVAVQPRRGLLLVEPRLYQGPADAVDQVGLVQQLPR